MLYAFGRCAQADVTVTGAEQAVSRLAGADLRQ
jgi:hypothetical protein